MAKSKQDYIDLGMQDGLKGNESNKPKSGWQLVSYTEGWQAGCDEKASREASVAAYQSRVKQPMFKRAQQQEAPLQGTRNERDHQRRAEATMAKLANRRERRQLRLKGAPRRLQEYRSHNIKRSEDRDCL